MDHVFNVSECRVENEYDFSSSVDVVYEIHVEALLRCLLPGDESDDDLEAMMERYESDDSLTKEVRFAIRARAEELTRSFVWNMFYENNVPVQDYMVEGFLNKVNSMKAVDPNGTRKVLGVNVFADIYVEELEPEEDMEVEFVTIPAAEEAVASLEKVVVVDGMSLDDCVVC